MGKMNQSFLNEFLILGLSQKPDLQVPLFVVFSFLYLITLLGNLVIITIVCVDRHLHTPMYYFLMNLSFLDIGLTSSVIPKMLQICATGNRSINFSVCLLQFYLCFSFISTEYFLVSVMAFDRYIAICNPLRYTVVMNKRVVALLPAASWIVGFLDPILHTVLISKSFFCGSNNINHFFCDLSALLKLSCTDTSFINSITFGAGVVMGLGLFISTFTSYVVIISKVIRMPSSTGRQKAFSTCSSHLTAIVLFYGTELGLYMKPASWESLEKDKVFSVLFIIVIPMLNPFIYSLRNNDVKRALSKTRVKIWGKHTVLC
ncbi:putative olfactory receptor 1F12P [Lissotriton helveticus]